MSVTVHFATRLHIGDKHPDHSKRFPRGAATFVDQREHLHVLDQRGELPAVSDFDGAMIVVQSWVLEHTIASFAKGEWAWAEVLP